MAYVDRVGDVWRTTHVMLVPNSNIQEINLSWSIIAAGVGDSRSNLLTYLDNLMITNIRSTLASTCAYYGSKISYLSTLLAYAPLFTRPNVAGTGGGTMLPAQTRVVVKETTDLVGRRYRGRVFGFTPDNTFVATNERPAGALLSAWNTLGSALTTLFVSAGTTWQLGIWHRRKPTEPYTPPTTVTGMACSGKWGTQRRSGDYGRPNTAVPW